MTSVDFEATFGLEQEISNEIDASFGALKIKIDGINVTEFKAEHESNSDHLEMPTYYLAEWIAENWWALLWEPHKSEDRVQDDTDFLSRHSILAAQHGFHLPQVQFTSSGRNISVVANPRNVAHSDIRFNNRASAHLPRNSVQASLAKFVDETVKRLAEKNFDRSYLSECWAAVKNTPSDAVEYCELLGALGLSPYAENPDIDKTIDELSSILGDAYMRDLCLVARPEELSKTGHAAKVAVAAVNDAPETDLSKIIDLSVPPDRLSTPAWQRGRHAANILRNRLHISEMDQKGADKVFEAIGFDATHRAAIGNKDFQPEGAAIVGAVRRNDSKAQIACIQKHQPQRRFTAARAVFTAWSSNKYSGNLLTQAVTRQQQASRAFAAEILAPLDYIRQWSSSQRITNEDVLQISRNLNVGDDVVRKQAENNGLSVARA